MRFITYARKSIIKPILLRFLNERQIIKLHFIYKRSPAKSPYQRFYLRGMLQQMRMRTRHST
ncbi:hypothetical protein [uncultured Helicobacter sp.]|uniref:hypothetical protein n=1 Tax=uncultured Helicobacter sp. TaxID=175537 RepID=UPI002623F8A7|nr:hypothetical protein [uncultured Helicobacter sp.]